MIQEDLLETFADSTVGVYGYGNTGRTLVEFLNDRTGELIIYDDSPRRDAPGGSVKWVTAPTVLQEDLDFLLVSPGVPGDHPVLRQAREFGIPVWGDLELSYRLLEQGTIWAITGTNGKSTCTELLGRLLEQRHGESAVAVCGNRGSPFVEQLMREPVPEHFVVEVSSFQVENMVRFQPDAAVLTNLGDDHMDYHASLQEYHGLKLDLLKRVEPGGTVVVPESESGRDWLGLRNLVTVDRTEMTVGSTVWDPGQGLLVGGDEIDVSEIPSSLRDFPENLLAVLGALDNQISTDQVRLALEAFEPLPYRAEPIDTSNGKTVINDSKGTNPSAVTEQLARRDEPVHLLLGGEAKEADYRTLLETVKRKDVLSITLAGEGSTARELSSLCDEETLDYDWVRDWEDAVKSAFRRTGDREILLLSPGGTSFDAFENYKKRGEYFDRWVKELDEQ